MPVRASTRGTTNNPWVAWAGPITDRILLFLYVAVPLVAVASMVRLAWDAFQVSWEDGFRSLCAAFLPLTLGSYLFRMRRDWLEAVQRIPSLGVSAAAAVGAVAVILAMSRQGGANVFPQLTLSSAFAALLVLRIDVHSDPPPIDEKLIHAVAAAGITAMTWGVVALGS